MEQCCGAYRRCFQCVSKPVAENAHCGVSAVGVAEEQEVSREKRVV